MSHDHYHAQDFENIRERKFYRSFQTNKEIPMEEVVSFDKEDLWRTLDSKRAKYLIENKDKYELNDDQVKALKIYLVMRYASDYLVEFEVMHIAEIIVYELNQHYPENNTGGKHVKRQGNDEILHRLIDLANDPSKSKKYKLGVLDSIKTFIKNDF